MFKIFRHIDEIEKQEIEQNRAKTELKLKAYKRNAYIVTARHGLQTVEAYEAQREIDGIADMALISENLY